MALPSAESWRFPAAGLPAPVEALWRCPEGAWGLLVLAHGAGAGMQHPFLEALSERLAAAGLATARYQFPYMQAGRKRPDPPALLEGVVRAAAVAASARAPTLPLFAGGKSMGGRMSSQAAAKAALPSVRGLVFFGFPLHHDKRPATTRAAHLEKVTLPMLFLQGTRDGLADLALMREVQQGLGARARLTEIDGADHSFGVLKSSGRTAADVLDQLAATASGFCRELATGNSAGVRGSR